MKTLAAFLSDPSHQIVFHFTPKHCSWLNQIEMWLSILVRKLLRRASLLSTAQLKTRILELIDYFNRTMAQPFKWTDQGKALKQSSMVGRFPPSSTRYSLSMKMKNSGIIRISIEKGKNFLDRIKVGAGENANTPQALEGCIIRRIHEIWVDSN